MPTAESLMLEGISAGHLVHSPCSSKASWSSCPGQCLNLIISMDGACTAFLGHLLQQPNNRGWHNSHLPCYLWSSARKTKGILNCKGPQTPVLSNSHFFAGLAQVNLPSILPEKREGGFKVTLKRGSVTHNRFWIFLWLRQTGMFILFHSILCFTLLSKSYYDFRNVWKIKTLKGHNLKCFFVKMVIAVSILSLLFTACLQQEMMFCKKL